MKIRKPTLSEWFLHYQLTFAFFKYAHCPYNMDVDVTDLVMHAETQGIRFSPTAVTIKAVALMAEKLPHLNRLLFHSVFGLRIGEPSDVRINLPVMIENQGKPVLSAMVLGDLHSKAAPEIHGEIKAFSKSDLSDKPVGRFTERRRNTWYNRLLLRGLHFMAYRLPRLHLKKGGGAFSVSSLIRRDGPQMWLRGNAVGHTAITTTVNGLKQTSDNRYILLLGMDCNHSILSGDEFTEACSTLASLLNSPNLDAYYPSS